MTPFLSSPISLWAKHRIAARLRMIVSLIVLGLSTLLAFGPAAHAQSYAEQPLYSFGTNPGEQGIPYSGMINVNGIFYGTTRGDEDNGTIFSFDPKTNAETVLYVFDFDHGSGPEADLINVNGILYGTTEAGGAYSGGTVFSFDPKTKTEKVLHSFAYGTSDGDSPKTSLTALNGILYGTTTDGSVGGTIYTIKPDGTGYQTLYTFQYNLAFPSSLVAFNGILYGTTEYGGNPAYSGDSEGAGTIFSFDPSTSTLQTVYQFKDVFSDGTNPGGLYLLNGIFYGATTYGGHGQGVVYSFDPSQDTEKILYQFENGLGYPDSRFTAVNGILYGTTGNGAYGTGTVFSLNPSTHRETTLCSFFGGTSDGSIPNGSLVFDNGILYGTTENGGTSDTGTIFSLIPVPLAAADDTYAPKSVTPYVVSSAKGVLANDNAEGKGALSATLVSPPSHGTLTLNHDGSFTYTGNSGFAGTDVFRYYCTNTAGRSNTAVVTLMVQAVAPIARNDSASTLFQTALTVSYPGVLANDETGGSTPLTAILSTKPAHGSLTFNSNGSFTYTPNAGFAGTDTFTYKDTNPVGTSNTATVTLNVQAVLPKANNDTYAPKYATVFAVSAAKGVLANDYTGDNVAPTAVLVTNVSHGTLTFNSNGSFTYTPNAGFAGTDTFTYKDTNPVGASNTATVTLKVQATAPVAHNDAYTVKHNTRFAVKAPGVLGNDYAGDSGSFTASLVSSVTHGTLSFKSDGSFTYTPTTGFTGTDTFTYQAKNAIGTSNTATVTLTVQ